MALTTYFKADNTADLNLTGSWTVSPAGPPPASTTSRARWDSTITTIRSAALGASTTWGQIVVVNPGGICTIAATAATTLTLTPTDADAAGVGIDMSAATQNFTIAEPIVLGSAQSWNVASGRTLTVSGIVSGAFSLTLAGTGTKTLSAANTFGGAGQTVTVAAGIVNASAVNALGNTNNAVVVSSGAQLATAAVIPAQTSFSVAGFGFTGGTGYGAISTTAAWAATKTITATATGTVLSIGINGSFLPVISVSGGVTSITLNIASNGQFPTQSSYTVSGGVRIQSLASNGTTEDNGLYSFGATAGATDANTNAGGGLGANSNAVIVEATGGIGYFNTTVTNAATLYRNYTFLGSSVGSVQLFTVSLDFLGNVTLSGAGTTVSTSPFRSTAPYARVAFGGTLSGDADLNNYTANGSSINYFKFYSTLNATAYSGTLRSRATEYATQEGMITCPVVFNNNPSVDGINPAGAFTNHSAHSSGTNTMGFTGTYPLTMSGGAWTSTPGTWTVSASVLTLNFSFTTTSGAFAKAGAGTLVLAGDNTSFTGLSWSAGNLYLNSAGSAGPSAATATITSTGTFDNTSGSPVTLTATGAWAWNAASFVWGGSNDLTRNSAVSYGAARTLTFVTGKSATLKVGSITPTLGATITLNVGGGVASTSRLWIAGTSTSTATTSSVTSGYLRAGNAASLGAVGTTTSWSVSNGAAIELDGGITMPGTKNGAFIGNGPNTDGALRSTTSGTNKWQGSIQFTNAAGGRIKATDGTTLTLDPTGSPAYTGIDGTSSCPVYFDAGISATLNQDRILANTVGIVYCGNNGSSSGRVVLSKANQHTGALNCESGTTALTNQNAAGPASTGAGVNVKQSARLAVEVASTYKAVFPGTTALGVGATSYAARAYFRIGA